MGRVPPAPTAAVTVKRQNSLESMQSHKSRELPGTTQINSRRARNRPRCGSSLVTASASSTKPSVSVREVAFLPFLVIARASRDPIRALERRPDIFAPALSLLVGEVGDDPETLGDMRRGGTQRSIIGLATRQSQERGDRIAGRPPRALSDLAMPPAGGLIASRQK